MNTRTDADQRSRSDVHSAAKDRTGCNMHAVTNVGIVLDDRTAVDDGVIADDDAIVNDRAWTNEHANADMSRRTDPRAMMHHGNKAQAIGPERGDTLT